MVVRGRLHTFRDMTGKNGHASSIKEDAPVQMQSYPLSTPAPEDK